MINNYLFKKEGFRIKLTRLSNQNSVEICQIIDIRYCSLSFSKWHAPQVDLK